MEIENTIDNNIEKNNFLGNILKGAVNNALDIGIKAVLPDLIENQVIDIKNALIENGLKAGVDTAVDSALDLGKSALGIVTGNFENMSQIKNVVDQGGIIDTVSNLIDKVVNKTYMSGKINSTVSNAIKTGKNIVLSNISSNIASKIEEQTYSIGKLEEYVENWKGHYNNKDIEGMDREYKKIVKQLSNAVPIENILKETRQIEVLHNLIKNNGNNFELSDEQKRLVENLAL